MANTSPYWRPQQYRGRAFVLSFLAMVGGVYGAVKVAAREETDRAATVLGHRLSKGFEVGTARAKAEITDEAPGILTDAIAQIGCDLTDEATFPGSSISHTIAPGVDISVEQTEIGRVGTVTFLGDTYITSIITEKGIKGHGKCLTLDGDDAVAYMEAKTFPGAMLRKPYVKKGKSVIECEYGIVKRSLETAKQTNTAAPTFEPRALGTIGPSLVP